MKYLRRIIWFVATRLLTLFFVLGIMIVVFYYAMNLTNIQIILKDGLAGRAKVIMGMETNTQQLSRYFQQSCLAGDPELTAAAQGQSPYADYNIRGIDHRLEMGFLWVWPWENAAQLNLKERIPRIDGRVKGLKADELIARNGESAIYPPAWPDREYRALLVKENGQWKLKSLTTMQAR